MIKIIFISFLMMLLTGCSSTVKRFQIPAIEDHERQFKAERVNPIKTHHVKGFLYSKDGLSTMPDNQVSFKMEGELSLEHFWQMLAVQGVNVVTRLKKTVSDNPDPKSKKNKTEEQYKSTIYLADYNGSLKALLRNIQKNYGYFFEYEKGVLVVKDKSPVYVKVIMPGMEKPLIELLGSLGVKNAFYDKLSNRIAFESDYYKYKKLVEYFKQNNYLTLVNFDVIILESETENEIQFGMDWSKFSSFLNFTAIDRDLDSANIEIKPSNGIFSFSFAGDFFKIGAFLSNNESHHDFKIVQNARVSSLNGSPCKLDVSEKVPYVSEVSLGALNDSNNIVQSFKFDTASSGLVLNLTPNVVNDFITLAFNAQIQNVTEFITVGTEAQFQQPVISVRNIENNLVLTPGRVSLIGGLRYKKSDFRRSGLVDVPAKWGLRSSSGRQFVLSVLLRPEIIKYVFV